MLLHLRTILLLVLVALSTAAPTLSLEARTKSKKLPDAVECKAPGCTVTFTKIQINAARQAGKPFADAQMHRKHGKPLPHGNVGTQTKGNSNYPKEFLNKNGNTKIFNVPKPDTSVWFEYPILTRGADFGGSNQGIFRVIFKSNGEYVGLTYHKNNPSYACTTKTDAVDPKKEDDDKKKKEEDDMKQKEADDKKKKDDDVKKKKEEDDKKKKADEDAKKKKADEDAKIKKADGDAKKNQGGGKKPTAAH